MKNLFHRWPLHAIAAFGITTLALLCYLRSVYDVYAVAKLVYLPVLAVPAFLLISLISNGFLSPVWQRLAGRQHRTVVLAGAVLLAGALWLFPPPAPDFLQPHQLVISATSRNNRPSTGSLVELRSLRSLTRRELSAGAVRMTPDWSHEGDIYLSSGAPSSRLEILEETAVGVVLHLRYQPSGGIVRITWNGVTEEIDLFKRASIVAPLVLRGGGLFTLPPAQAAFSVLIAVLYAAGIAALLLAGLTLLYRLAGRRAERLAYGLAVLGLALLFFLGKWSYLQADGPHAMLDSFNYVAAAEAPLASLQFWAGIRSFTLPLAIKAVGLHVDDFSTTGQLARWARFQTVFSVFSWLALALVLARTVRERWLRVAMIGLVLTFALSLEVSLWDALLLSESLSFSLLALMLAGWVWMLVELPAARNGWLRLAGLFASVLVTVLYVFVRDSNGFYALAAALVLAFGSLLAPRLAGCRKYLFLYAALVVMIFAGQYYSLSFGNRWQVFIYDHLAMRILRDAEATRFFAQEGLPLSDGLMAITEMDGKYYFPMLRDEPAFAPVRDWVNCCGKGAYVKYLLSNPLRTFREPFEHWPALLNGSLRGYRNPRGSITPVPQKVQQLSDFYFQKSAWAPLLLGLVILLGLTRFLFAPDEVVWIAIAAVALPVIPMMYLIWFGEPMEIERHAAQVIIQFRLAGWLALLLLAAWVARRMGK